MIKLHHGDCLEVMRSIPDGSIDLTVTSPPYDNLRSYKGYSFDFEGIARQLFRVTKTGGVVVWVVGDATVKGSETGTSFRQALFFKEIGFNLHDTMIYMVRGTGAKGSNYCYWQEFEYMFIFSKGKPKTINFLTVKKIKSGGGSRLKKDGSKKVEKRKNVGKLIDSKIGNVWTYSVGNNKVNHPAIFPLQLAKDHIISWSNESDIVLDPFMGSGTTGAACVELNRSFIGIEIAQEYQAIANKRIIEAIIGESIE